MKLLVFRVAEANATEAAKLEALSIFDAREVLRHLRDRAAEPVVANGDVLWQAQKGLIRLRGHLPCEEYDVQTAGRPAEAPRPAPVHR